MSIRWGYGTNGFANHRLDDALAIIAELGYQGVALTLDHGHLDPYAPDLRAQVDRTAHRLAELGLTVVIETGARYLLDPRRKHSPTFLHDDPAPRLDFLKRAADIAADLGAQAMSCWSGVRPAHVPEAAAWDRLADGVAQVLEHARQRQVVVGFEPEPGMLVDTLATWRELRDRVGDGLGLTLDIGHCRANEPADVPECVRQAGPHLVNVQIDDMVRGVHEHLEFGEGEIDFPPVLRALADTGYDGLVAVELARHSHAAPEVAARSLTFLRAAQWLGDALARVRRDPAALAVLLPAARRHVGADGAEGARIRLLQATLLSPEQATDLYRYGDNDEKRAVLRAWPSAELLRDALRSNDTRLVAAALGQGAELLSDAEWRQAVLKSVFMGLPLAQVHDLDRRADAELGRMLDGLRREREAAGRTMPADAVRLLERLL
ncbi:TIM barrel protein [Catellatospora sp. KI3]|uniref:TIM barrel protein n=1 Tax=Catellatospora sp. KI3 TaxID=3041620 RepID=UPI0024825FB6|nr:TIM barrel protein [Catellatospora sp. KI3]MDI1465031.1 TIM barrel protein [Catellatospora sp. KI3]